MSYAYNLTIGHILSSRDLPKEIVDKAYELEGHLHRILPDGALRLFYDGIIPAMVLAIYEDGNYTHVQPFKKYIEETLRRQGIKGEQIKETMRLIDELLNKIEETIFKQTIDSIIAKLENEGIKYEVSTTEENIILIIQKPKH